MGDKLETKFSACPAYRAAFHTSRSQIETNLGRRVQSQLISVLNPLALYLTPGGAQPHIIEGANKMALPTPPKLVLDDFIATALSATPRELHPYFESFKSLYTRKWVCFFL